MRTIKIFTTNGVAGNITTDAKTLGDLIPLLDAKGINHAGMSKMVGETRNTLDVDESVLPLGDFKLYIIPSKTKSGAINVETARAISSLITQLAEAIEDAVEEMEAAQGEEEEDDMDDFMRAQGLM